MCECKRPKRRWSCLHLFKHCRSERWVSQVADQSSGLLKCASLWVRLTQKKPNAFGYDYDLSHPTGKESFLPRGCHLILKPLKFCTTDYRRTEVMIICATAALVPTLVTSLNWSNSFLIGHPDPDLSPFNMNYTQKPDNPSKNHKSNHLFPLFRTL